jgi:hypothetical protein
MVVMGMGVKAGGGGAPGDIGATDAVSSGNTAVRYSDAVPTPSVNAGVVDGYGVLQGIGK